MSAEKIITALLRAHSPLVAVVSTRIGPGPLPQGTALPALATNLISNVRRNTVSTAEAAQLFRSRMQITVLASSYSQQKALIRLVSDACKYQRGTIAGSTGVSVLPDIEGPDMRDDDASIYMQTIDFSVSYQGT